MWRERQNPPIFSTFMVSAVVILVVCRYYIVLFYLNSQISILAFPTLELSEFRAHLILFYTRFIVERNRHYLESGEIVVAVVWDEGLEVGKGHLGEVVVEVVAGVLGHFLKYTIIFISEYFTVPGSCHRDRQRRRQPGRGEQRRKRPSFLQIVDNRIVEYTVALCYKADDLGM